MDLSFETAFENVTPSGIQRIEINLLYLVHQNVTLPKNTSGVEATLQLPKLPSRVRFPAGVSMTYTWGTLPTYPHLSMSGLLSTFVKEHSPTTVVSLFLDFCASLYSQSHFFSDEKEKFAKVTVKWVYSVEFP